MNNTKVLLKNIAQMVEENISFYIDSYQRGYRWSENEVKALLEDIHEFSQMSQRPEDLFYCLQPIIVTKKEDDSGWKVIDGQQRLTTLYLIYIYYVSIEGKHKKTRLPYSLSYSKKPELENCLLELKDSEIDNSDDLNDLFSKYEDDIDCFYVINAYKTICDFFNKLEESTTTETHVDDMKKVFNLYAKIIWYEILNCTTEQEISVFTKINMGKIPLTNAELIKALLLKNDVTDDDSEELQRWQESIAIKWDEIESQLREENFWSFIVNEGEDVYSTRIDFIFRIMARYYNQHVLKEADEKFPNDEKYAVSESSNKDKFSFYVFNNYVRYLTKHPEQLKDDKEKSYQNIIWEDVCDYFRMFTDWYHKKRWYHLIGFLVEISKDSFIETLSKLCEIYRQQEKNPDESEEDKLLGDKTKFEKRLREEICKEIFGDEHPDFNKCNDAIDELEYNKNDPDIRNMLLLYNISYLELENKEDSRFPFEKYKNKKQQWDIEHINAVADDIPKDYKKDSEENDRKLWLERTEFIPDDLVLEDGRNVKELISKILKEKLYLDINQPGTRDFTAVYEKVIEYFSESDTTDNKIGNLTLLDCGTNRSYKNYIFPVKRKIIIENSMKDVFIPVCTKYVFLKAYKESQDLLKWRNIDKETYRNDIALKISDYLGIKKEEADGTNE